MNYFAFLLVMFFSKEIFPYDEEVIVVFCSIFVFWIIFNVIEKNGKNFMENKRISMVDIWNKFFFLCKDYAKVNHKIVFFFYTMCFIYEIFMIRYKKLIFKGCSYCYYIKFLYNNSFLNEILQYNIYLEMNAFQLLYFKKLNLFFKKVN